MLSIAVRLNAAERRGVVIRIVLDPREHHDFVELGDLADKVRIKRGGPLMHLKAYDIDGATLRTGSANFSASGERQQDNDLIVIRDVGAAAKFDTHFERMWQAAQPMIEFGPAIEALEPGSLLRRHVNAIANLLFFEISVNFGGEAAEHDRVAAQMLQ